MRPLIFSTELARSAKEVIKHPHVLRDRLKALSSDIDKAPTATAVERRRKGRLEREFDKVVGSIDRSIAVFGAINVRTDDHKIVIAQKLEKSEATRRSGTSTASSRRAKGASLQVQALSSRRLSCQHPLSGAAASA